MPSPTLRERIDEWIESGDPLTLGDFYGNPDDAKARVAFIVGEMRAETPALQEIEITREILASFEEEAARGLHALRQILQIN